MSIRLLYSRHCDEPGCRAWTGAVRRYPDEFLEDEEGSCRRMGWTLYPDFDGDYCPEHSGRERRPRRETTGMRMTT